MTQNSKLLRAEQLTAYERWELPNHNPPPAEPEPSATEEELPLDTVAPLTLEQLEQIQKEAYDEGFKLGKEEGLTAGHKEGMEQALKVGAKQTAAEVQRLQQIIEAFTAPLAEVDEVVETELVALAVAIARQLIRRELKGDPKQIVGVVREAMSALPAQTRKVRIQLHPEDIAIIREHMLIGEREEEAWRLVEDPVLTRGGCRIVTEHSQVDATVEKRLNAVVSQLLGGERGDDGSEPQE